MEEETRNKYSVGEIATQTGMSAINNETGKPIDVLDLLVGIANDIEVMKKKIS